ncbi:PadR family transcriptional regulator [Rugamonas apoptosis]|uniref:PadR family transcriptional regulator n=1 Tax=Rugamonas apoptosis TaxID=2758570 RepID=A0A7W2FCW2_9BURK|nr:PadR family transcriptional regulator [Rugamonas apoptosis]MBA5689391.1 PadR family transcriptional regulator [Rugamonas apoptosis]
MNLSKNEAVILGLLVAGEREMYGLEMVKKSDGKLKLGTIYVTLSRLEDKGFLKSRKEMNDSVVPRRLYEITGSGTREIRAWTAAMSEYQNQLCGVENDARIAQGC